MKHRNHFWKANLLRRKDRLRSHGFSLIELLVAIGIVAVLAALAFSVISKARASATSAKCVGNIRSMMVAYQAWFNDINRQFPQVNTNIQIPYSTYLAPYLGGTTLRCPLATPAELKVKMGFQYAPNDALRRHYSVRAISEYASRTVMVGEMYDLGTGLSSSTHLTNTFNGSSGRGPQNHGGGLNLGFWDGSVKNVKPAINPTTGKGDFNVPPAYGNKTEGYFYGTPQLDKIKEGTW